MSGPASVRLGTIAGAPVRLSWSWLLIAAVITLAFGPQIQRALPSLGGGAYAVALGYAVLLALSVLAHEAAHALTGRAFGQRTEEIALTLWGGHTQFRSPSARPLDTVLTAMAGPAANLVLAGLAHLAARAVPGPSVPALLLEVTVWANLLLAAFNALPGTPLDGGRMVESYVDRLVTRLRPHIMDVVAAFDFPQELLRAKIASGAEAQRQQEDEDRVLAAEPDHDAVFARRGSRPSNGRNGSARAEPRKAAANQAQPWRLPVAMPLKKAPTLQPKAIREE